MNKQEALELLRRGESEIWNQYRKDHPNWIPDLEGEDLTHITLAPPDQDPFDLTNANLTGAKLPNLRRLLPFRSHLDNDLLPSTQVHIEVEGPTYLTGAMINLSTSIAGGTNLSILVDMGARFVFEEDLSRLRTPVGSETSKLESKEVVEVTSILFLAADPTDASRLRLGEEFREIHERLQLAQLRDRFKLELPQLSVRPTDISQALLDAQPKIVHFSGHGTPTGALCFEDNVGKTHLVPPDALAALFEQFAHQVKCVLLNACYTGNQAKAIAEHIKYVIGMDQAIGDKAAIAFAVGFYQALGAGRTIEKAYNLGCVQIGLQGIPEQLTPVLIKKGRLHSK